MSDTTSIDDEMALKMMKSVMAAHDSEYQLWDRESVEFSRQQYQKQWGRIPSIETVAEIVGVDRATQMIPEIVEWRKFDHALKAKCDPCHFCGSQEKLKRYEFGLMRVESSKRNWSEAVATVAISAVTLPLAGVGRVHLPSKSYSGSLLRLNLVACDACVRKNSNFLGLFFVKEKHAMHHPLWQSLQDSGFTKYVAPDDLEKDILGYMKL